MIGKLYFRLVHKTARDRAIEAIRNAPDGWVVLVQEPTRTLEQNSLMWPILTMFSKQLSWPVNGELTQLTPAEWKDILSAAFRQELTRLAAGINGGMVMLGLKTREMGKKEFSEFMEFIFSVASEKGVKIDD